MSLTLKTWQQLQVNVSGVTKGELQVREILKKERKKKSSKSIFKYKLQSPFYQPARIEI